MHTHPNILRMSTAIRAHDQAIFRTEFCPPRECGLPDDFEITEGAQIARELLIKEGVTINPGSPVPFSLLYTRHNCSVPGCSGGDHKYQMNFFIDKEQPNTEDLGLLRQNTDNDPRIMVRLQDMSAKVVYAGPYVSMK